MPAAVPWTSGTAEVGASAASTGAGDDQFGDVPAPGAVDVVPHGVDAVGVDGDGPLLAVPLGVPS
jgi:hypothetical protein